MKYVKLGDLLVKSGAITQAQLDEALSLQAETGQRLGSVLQDRRWPRFTPRASRKSIRWCR